MSTDIRSIKGIERSPGYLSVHSLNRYSLYPNRGGEPKLPAPSYSEWNDALRNAARSAADWLKLISETQAKIDRLMARYSQLTLHHGDVREGRAIIAKLLNDLYSNFMKHQEELRPELWERIELTLRHPALAELSFSRAQSEEKIVEAPQVSFSAGDEPLQKAETDKVKRLLTGAYGYLTQLKQAIDYNNAHQPIELLRSGWHTMKPYMPYMAYYSSMQTYFPMPMVGMLVNRMY